MVTEKQYVSVLNAELPSMHTEYIVRIFIEDGEMKTLKTPFVVELKYEATGNCIPQMEWRIPDVLESSIIELVIC